MKDLFLVFVLFSIVTAVCSVGVFALLYATGLLDHILDGERESP